MQVIDKTLLNQVIHYLHTIFVILQRNIVTALWTNEIKYQKIDAILADGCNVAYIDICCSFCIEYC